jgi:hypothetical protein
MRFCTATLNVFKICIVFYFPTQSSPQITWFHAK